MADLKINIKNLQDIDPQYTGATLPEGTVFNLLSYGELLASAALDSNNNLNFSVADGTDMSQLALKFNLIPARQVFEAVACQVVSYIPAAPTAAPTIDWDDQPDLPSTPFGPNWVASESDEANTVSYAVTFVSLTRESEMGPWSEAYPITTKACPVIRNVPVCDKNSIPETQSVYRNIYRKIFNSEVGEDGGSVFVGSIMNNNDDFFQDTCL